VDLGQLGRGRLVGLVEGSLCGLALGLVVTFSFRLGLGALGRGLAEGAQDFTLAL
jgi:hypothetical protein